MKPRVMGIVNANPDSFSDPGARALDELVKAALAQVEAGADLIDVGGESGVTHTAPVSAEECRCPRASRWAIRRATAARQDWSALT